VLSGRRGGGSTKSRGRCGTSLSRDRITVKAPRATALLDLPTGALYLFAYDAVPVPITGPYVARR